VEGVRRAEPTARNGDSPDLPAPGSGADGE
jgi:hypothetical protein